MKTSLATRDVSKAERSLEELNLNLAVGEAVTLTFVEEDAEDDY